MSRESGQVAIEILAIAAISTVLLALVLMYVYQWNAETGVISDTSLNRIQCNAVSDTISNIYNNRAEAEQVLYIEREAHIKRENSVGGITVGNIVCRYVGIVQGDEEYGRILEQYKRYKFWKQYGEVAICEIETC